MCERKANFFFSLEIIVLGLKYLSRTAFEIREKVVEVSKWADRQTHKLSNRQTDRHYGREVRTSKSGVVERSLVSSPEAKKMWKKTLQGVTF